MTDSEIRDHLRHIYNDDEIDVTALEAEFLENVLHEYSGPLTGPQRAVAEKMILEYL